MFITLLKAFKIVKEKINDANLIIIGERDERLTIEKLTKELNLQDVYLLRFQDNSHKYISKCDLFVLSSL